jgi:hypothetical protein
MEFTCPIVSRSRSHVTDIITLICLIVSSIAQVVRVVAVMAIRARFRHGLPVQASEADL